MKAHGAGLAQLVEHLICNQGVGGSSPLAGTILFQLIKLYFRAKARLADIGKTNSSAV